LPAIPDENTDVIASVHVDSTLASNLPDPTRYDRRVSAAPESPRRRLVRLVVVPAALFIGVSATVFTLAQIHPAKPEVAAASGPVKIGDARAGQVTFAKTCAGCHGAGGKGGGIGPRLAGASITLARAKAQIDAGSGAMPPALVSGTNEENVLAYLDTIFAR
jgi:mono/diheme cytochrome c family protein